MQLTERRPEDDVGCLGPQFIVRHHFYARVTGDLMGKFL